MSTQTVAAAEKMVFRNTASKPGRNISVTPRNSTNEHLSYGRIILNAGCPSVSFANKNEETGLIVLAGEVTLRTAGQEFTLTQFDSVYIPRDSQVEVSSGTVADIAEFSADVEKRYPLKVVRFTELSKDPGLKFAAGSSAAQRQLHMLLAKNVEAGRLVAGFTYSEPGNWTSWPP